MLTTQQSFTKENTNTLKGLAVLLLLMHHGFQSLEITFSILGVDVIRHLFLLGKICVAIFTVLSGYGLHKAYERDFGTVQETGTKEGSDTRFNSSIGPGLLDEVRFTSKYLIRFFGVFWVCFLISILAGQAINQNLRTIYGQPFFYHLALDALGISNFLRTPQFVGSWWYVFVITLSYLLFPLLHRICRRLKLWNLGIILAMTIYNAFATHSPYVYYVYCFYIGLVIAELKPLDYFVALHEKNSKLYRSVVLTSLIVLTLLTLFRNKYLDRSTFYYQADHFLTFLLMILCIASTKALKPIHRFLAYIGQYSFGMYLLHPFFIRHFQAPVFFSGGVTHASPLQIFVMLTLVSFASAWVVDKGLEVSGYNGLMLRLSKHKNNWVFTLVLVTLIIGLGLPILLAR